MQNTFKSVSLTYRKASVEIRSLLSLDEATCKLVLQHIKDLTNVSEAMVVSTCNRTEIYYSSTEDKSDELIKLIAIVKGVNHISDFKSHFNIFTNHDEAINHLFEVSMGLDAQVIGDIQISNQIKKAYQYAADLELAGPFLHRIMHAVFFTNKRVVQETTFRDGAASVSYAAVEMAEDISSSFVNPKALIIGLGEMGVDVARNFLHSEFEDVTLCNRTDLKAETLATELGFKTLPFSQLHEELKTYDVIISSVSVENFLITKTDFPKTDVLSYKYVVDMGIPRSVDPEVESIAGIVLYDIDQIQNKTTKTLQKRINAIPDVRGIISEAIIEFNQWAREMEVSPIINKLKTALEQIRQEEISRYTKKLSQSEASQVDKITKSMMQKVIKLPVLQLKAACKRGEAETLVDVLNELFDLENAEETMCCPK
jgi:glutamyl-tRNA reductase